MSRFERQLPIFGDEGQNRILSARVGIAGCGGLGVNVITALAEAGVSHFVLADPQMPDITNLNRQYIYTAGDLRPKAEVAAQWILALNPYAEIEAHPEPLSVDTRAMFRGCDILVDCLDSFEARMVLGDLSEEMGVPLVHGGISGTEGQIAVTIPGKTPCLRCMLGTMRDQEGPIPAVGAAVATIGSMEALEVLKIISGLGTETAGKLVTVDMSTWTTESVEISGDPDCKVCGGR